MAAALRPIGSLLNGVAVMVSHHRLADSADARHALVEHMMVVARLATEVDDSTRAHLVRLGAAVGQGA